MKKIFYSVVALISLTFYSCSNDENGSKEELNTNKIENQSNLSLISRSKETIIIDSNEAPEFSDEIIDELGFTNFTIDTSRECVIDLSSNIVSLPYDSELSLRGDITIPIIGISVKIAKKNTKPGDGCISCEECLGFRCSGKIKILHILTIAQWRTKIDEGKDSSEREQEAYLTIDEDNKTVNIKFYNSIDWLNLK